MKAFILVLGLLLTVQAQALTDFSRSPFRSVTASAVNTLESKVSTLEASSSVASYAADGNLSLRVARATYNVSSLPLGTIGAHGLGIFLPAGAMITQSYYYINTQFVDAGSGTVAFSCEDAGNIYTAADITGKSIGAITAGNNTGTAATMVAAIAASCEITATVAGADQTSGKATLFVQYVMP